MLAVNFYWDIIPLKWTPAFLTHFSSISADISHPIRSLLFFGISRSLSGFANKSGQRRHIPMSCTWNSTHNALGGLTGATSYSTSWANKWLTCKGSLCARVLSINHSLVWSAATVGRVRELKGIKLESSSEGKYGQGGERACRSGILTGFLKTHGLTTKVTILFSYSSSTSNSLPANPHDPSHLLLATLKNVCFWKHLQAPLHNFTAIR